MKTTLQLTVLTVFLGAATQVSAQTNNTAPPPMENLTNNDIDTDDDSGKWGIAGLLGLLGLLGLRRNREDHHHDHATTTR